MQFETLQNFLVFCLGWSQLGTFYKNNLKLLAQHCKSPINYLELLTVIGDIQTDINSRPLAYRSSENCFREHHSKFTFSFSVHLSFVLKDTEDYNLWECDPLWRSALVETLDLQGQLLVHFRSFWYVSYFSNLRESYWELHEENGKIELRLAMCHCLNFLINLSLWYYKKICSAEWWTDSA